MDDKMTEKLDVKVSQVCKDQILMESAELDVARSDYIRACLNVGRSLCRRCPALMDIDRSELEKLAGDLCQMIVVQTAHIKVIESDEKIIVHPLPQNGQLTKGHVYSGGKMSLRVVPE